MDFAEVLVYILAAFLALFLLLAIILVVLLIRITRQIKDVTTTAKRTIGTVEKTVAGLQGAGTAAGLMKLVTSFVKKRRK